jgi:hypothetical protein
MDADFASFPLLLLDQASQLEKPIKRYRIAISR